MAKIILQNIHVLNFDKAIMEKEAKELYIFQNPHMDAMKITNQKIFHEMLKFFLGETGYESAKERVLNAIKHNRNQ